MSSPYTGTYFTCPAVPGWQSAGIDPILGAKWIMRTLTGWDEPPDARTSFTPRANAGGSFDAPVYDGDRVVSWSGLVETLDVATREKVKLQLATLGRALRQGADFVGNDADGVPKTVHARRSTGWNVAPFGPCGIQYQAQIVCPDPSKYGPPMSVATGLPTASPAGLAFPLFGGTGKLEFGDPGLSGQVTLTNTGTDDAWPTFVVTGPVLGGVVLTDVSSGRRIVYAGDVADTGVLLVVDSAVGRASLNSSDRTGLLTVRQWTPVPPGQSRTWQCATLGAPAQAGTCTATIKSTYQ